MAYSVNTGREGGSTGRFGASVLERKCGGKESIPHLTVIEIRTK